MYKHIPNTITSLNLLAGCIGIYYLAEINFYVAAMLIFVASVFDFLDGFSARLLKAYSPVGKSLDSLADLISFGLLPGLLFMKLQMSLTGIGSLSGLFYDQNFINYLFIFSPLMIPLASAIRLARFDNDPSQSWDFRGLPTPANAIFIAALVWSAPLGSKEFGFIYNSHVLLGMNLLLSFLLISPIRFLSLKFKTYGLKDNKARYLIIAFGAGTLIIWGIPGIMAGMAAYMIISVTSGLFPEGKKD